MPSFNRQGPPFGDGNQSGKRMGKYNPKSNRPGVSSEELELQNENITNNFGRRNRLGCGNGQGQSQGQGQGKRNRFRNQNFSSEE